MKTNMHSSLLKTINFTLLLCMLILAGCGGGEPESNDPPQAATESEEGTKEAEQDLLEILVPAGELEAGQDLSEQGAGALTNQGGLGDLEDISDTLADESNDINTDPDVAPEPEPDPDPNQYPLGLFEFDSPYSDLAKVLNPFPTAVISNDEHDLVNSDKLAMMAMPVGYFFDAGGRPNLITGEPQLVSPNSIDAATFSAFDYSAAGKATGITLYYELLDTSTGVTTVYEIPIAINDNITSTSDLSLAITSAMAIADVYVDGAIQAPGNPVHVLFSLQPDADSGDRFVFQPVTELNEYIVAMEMQLNDELSLQGQALLTQMGSTGANLDEWRASVETELVIGTGSWNGTDNTPILFLEVQEQDGEQAVDRTDTSTRRATPNSR